VLSRNQGQKVVGIGRCFTGGESRRRRLRGAAPLAFWIPLVRGDKQGTENSLAALAERVGQSRLPQKPECLECGIEVGGKDADIQWGQGSEGLDVWAGPKAEARLIIQARIERGSERKLCREEMSEAEPQPFLKKDFDLVLGGRGQ
jgi:hypothetical protein